MQLKSKQRHALEAQEFRGDMLYDVLRWVGEPVARRLNAARVNIWYGPHENFPYPF